MTIESLLREISEHYPVEIHYEPRNDGAEWRVSLVGTETPEAPIPVHEHFADLREGLLWLSRNGIHIANR